MVFDDLLSRVGIGVGLFGLALYVFAASFLIFALFVIVACGWCLYEYGVLWRRHDGARFLWLGGGVLWIFLAAGSLLWLKMNTTDSFMLWLLCVVVGFDSAAFLGGRMVGVTPLMKKISPQKTWEGLLCGVGMAFLVTAFFIEIAPQQKKMSELFLGHLPFILAGCLVGDGIESYAKRHFGVKDSSSALKSHGGVLDRMDALLGASLMGALAWSIL